MIVGAAWIAGHLCVCGHVCVAGSTSDMLLTRLVWRWRSSLARDRLKQRLGVTVGLCKGCTEFNPQILLQILASPVLSLNVPVPTWGFGVCAALQQLPVAGCCSCLVAPAFFTLMARVCCRYGPCPCHCDRTLRCQALWQLCKQSHQPWHCCRCCCCLSRCTCVPQLLAWTSVCSCALWRLRFVCTAFLPFSTCRCGWSEGPKAAHTCFS